jgi:hypothetical protein
LTFLSSFTTPRTVKPNGGSATARGTPAETAKAPLPPNDKERLAAWIAMGPHAVLDYLITPSMAMAMMERNHGNRRIRDRLVDQYAGQIGSGSWPLTGQPVIFSEDGTMNDGQHRLLACIKSGVPFRCDVRFGIPRASFMLTDVGAKRQSSDVLEIMGEKNAATLAAAAGHLIIWQRSDRKSIHRSYTAAPNEIVAIIRDCPHLRHSAAVGMRIHGHIRTMPSIMAFCHYVCWLSDPVLADRFFEQVASGEGMTKTDPAFVLRKRLIDAAQTQTMMPRFVLAGYVFKAWNAARKGDQIKVLRMMDGETLPEVA